jgi:hypothetical protein
MEICIMVKLMRRIFQMDLECWQLNPQRAFIKDSLEMESQMDMGYNSQDLVVNKE